MRPEDALQCACVDMLTKFVPQPPEGPAWRAIDPVTLKDVRIGRKCKEMGAKAGWPDLIFVWKPTFFVELKPPLDKLRGTAKGVLSKTQRDQFPIIEATGTHVHIVYSLDDLVEVLRAEGVPVNVRSLA